VKLFPFVREHWTRVKIFFRTRIQQNDLNECAMSRQQIQRINCPGAFASSPFVSAQRGFLIGRVNRADRTFGSCLLEVAEGIQVLRLPNDCAT
jgi:hypothetical protein